MYFILVSKVTAKDDYENVGSAFTKKGYAVAVINYTLSPKEKSWEFRLSWLDSGVHYPKHTQDCADAFRWLTANVLNKKNIGDEFFLAGHSAGGTLTLTLGFMSGNLMFSDFLTVEEKAQVKGLRGGILTAEVLAA